MVFSLSAGHADRTMMCSRHQAWDEDSSLVLKDEDEDFQIYEDKDKDEDSVL